VSRVDPGNTDETGGECEAGILTAGLSRRRLVPRCSKSGLKLFVGGQGKVDKVAVTDSMARGILLSTNKTQAGRRSWQASRRD